MVRSAPGENGLGEPLGWLCLLEGTPRKSKMSKEFVVPACTGVIDKWAEEVRTQKQEAVNEAVKEGNTMKLRRYPYDLEVRTHEWVHTIYK